MCRNNGQETTTSKGENWSRGTNPSLPFDVNVMLKPLYYMKTKFFQKKIISNEFRSNTLKGTKDRLVAKKLRYYFGGRGRGRGRGVVKEIFTVERIKS